MIGRKALSPFGPKMWVVVLLGLVTLSKGLDEGKTSFTSAVDLNEGDQGLVLKTPAQITEGSDEKLESNSTETEKQGPVLEEHKEDDHITVNFGSDWGFLLENINDTSHFGSALNYAVDSLNANGTGSRDDFLVIPKKLIQDTFSAANNRWIARQQKIESNFENKTGADAKSPVGTAYAFSPPNKEALILSNTSILLEFASREFLKTLEADPSAKSRVKRQTVTFIDENGIRATAGESRQFNVGNLVSSSKQGTFSVLQCGVHDEVLPCDPNNPYRTYSGFCNNLRNPSWGKSVSTFDRMIPSAYSDGISAPRTTSAVGTILPSPRMISRYVHIDVSHLSNKHTLMLMQYAQFLDHDLTLTPVHRGPEEKILNCRDCESYKTTHPECWPIPVPTGDSWYPERHENGRSYCIPFTRSLPGQQRLGPRDQINQNSAYMDASQIYGENVCKAETLRVAGGKLNATFSPSSSKPLMPQTSNLKECKSPSGYCFYAGDPRASEQPALAAVHTMFLRQHNHWADEMRQVNPHWSDEKVYQEVRRIMGAVTQHITYNELIPRILGPSMVNAYGLRLQTEGYYAGYDSNCNAAIFNEFATAAFRFGHSLIRPSLARMDGRYHGMNPHLQLKDVFFNSDMLYKPLMVDEIIRGLVAEPMEQLDPFVTTDITNHLFEDKKRSFSGLDLISLNIHRGRDHGLPGYNSYRAVCNLKKAESFNDLQTEIPDDVLQRLQKVYANVNDIDLFTGSLVERPVTGGILGPTMTCIIGSQFKRTRQCDRYWYETSDPAIRFNPQQLAEIRKMALSKIMCDSMDTPTDTQKMVMDAPHNILNPRMPCNRLPGLNLQMWRESSSVSSAPVSAPRPLALVSPPSPGMQVHSCTIAGKQMGVGGAGLQSPCVSCVCRPDGVKCASLRITSCQKLMQEASREDILRDTVCTSQCGFLLGTQPSRSPAFNFNRINSGSGRFGK